MMRDFRISINEKYQRNKAVIWFVIIVAVFVILVVKNYFKLMTSTRGSGVTPTSGSVSVNTSIAQNIINKADDDYNTIKKEITGQGINMNAIDLFIALCNSKKTNAAYEMLSDECKSILYPTKQEFIDNYYSVIFKTSKVYEATSFKNNTYKVKFSEDEITTGGTTPSDAGVVDYITVVDNQKINISGLVDRKAYEDKVSQSPYFTIYLKEKQRFVDHTVVKIKVKNTVFADIYINDEDNSELYLKDSNGSMYAVNTSDLFDSDYLVGSKAEKEISLNFNVGTINDVDFTELYMGKIVIVNKNYYDTSDEKEKMTKYPETYSWTINLK